MSNREALRLMIAQAAMEAAKKDAEVSINDLALSLSSTYPQSGITIEEICAEIEAALREARGCDASATDRDQSPR